MKTIWEYYNISIIKTKKSSQNTIRLHLERLKQAIVPWLTSKSTVRFQKQDKINHCKPIPQRSRNLKKQKILEVWSVIASELKDRCQNSESRFIKYPFTTLVLLIWHLHMWSSIQFWDTRVSSGIAGFTHQLHLWIIHTVNLTGINSDTSPKQSFNKCHKMITLDSG